mmetsp:Transcript_27587/g.71563  ORF Transcript_27587/g.71563 Transcript_27587/m.71563 type:complete len:429 (-) Transcript_27587:201-1487(-)
MAAAVTPPTLLTRCRQGSMVTRGLAPSWQWGGAPTHHCRVRHPGGRRAGGAAPGAADGAARRAGPARARVRAHAGRDPAPDGGLGPRGVQHAGAHAGAARGGRRGPRQHGAPHRRQPVHLHGARPQGGGSAARRDCLRHTGSGAVWLQRDARARARAAAAPAAPRLRHRQPNGGAGRKPGGGGRQAEVGPGQGGAPDLPHGRPGQPPVGVPAPPGRPAPLPGPGPPHVQPQQPDLRGAALAHTARQRGRLLVGLQLPQPRPAGLPCLAHPAGAHARRRPRRGAEYATYRAAAASSAKSQPRVLARVVGGNGGLAQAAPGPPGRPAGRQPGPAGGRGAAAAAGQPGRDVCRHRQRRPGHGRGQAVPVGHAWQPGAEPTRAAPLHPRRPAGPALASLSSAFSGAPRGCGRYAPCSLTARAAMDAEAGLRA